MKDLEKYVDGLFANYKKTKDIEDLREEILSNLEARIKDNMDSGLDYKEAYDEAVKNIESIDMFIDDNKEIYINKFKRELAQIGVLYALIGWIFTIPLRLIFRSMINNIFMIALICIGIIYLFMIYKKDDEYLSKTSIIDMHDINTLKRYTWIIWGIFMSLMTLVNFALRFASNVWFSRPVRIDGPYQFAMIVGSFFIPLLSIVIPLFINRACKLINEYEVN
ncbi:permease prefix domain 1-containing protein [uncultured Clostridium sp.]|uniref:permease prefix domain 1-containing protein n=1 Tax=uncultured Clostridium sp. TaxID=59620 RepID=UPI0028E6A8E0|nr:permease prefix domain 1-containing protein [uncultured Clostridium sp.]